MSSCDNAPDDFPCECLTAPWTGRPFDSKAIVICSLYADPIHVGHIRYLKSAKELGAHLFVIINNDAQATAKKGRPFMPANERLEIVTELSCVNYACIAIDEGPSVDKTLEVLFNIIRGGVGGEAPVIFANGGDVGASQCREAPLCDRLGIEMVFGVGGEKIQSSSRLIAQGLGR